MDSVTAPKREDMNRRDLLRLGVVGSAGIGGSLLMARHSFADECEIESREVCGQVEPKAGTWKTWVLASGSDLRLPPPPGRAATQRELETLESLANQRDTIARDRIKFWDAGAATEPAGCVVEATERSRVDTAMYEWVDHPQPFRIDADDRRS